MVLAKDRHGASTMCSAPGKQEKMGRVSQPWRTGAAAYLLPVQNVKQWESTTYRFGEEPGNPLKKLTFGSC